MRDHETPFNGCFLGDYKLYGLIVGTSNSTHNSNPSDRPGDRLIQLAITSHVECPFQTLQAYES